ncbi:MAG: flagellar hook-basal body complex protein FliE, partial [Syntrophomonas sp.]|nr:flagellar hook-basal body complex protein FliE [Syntrophomonas sp.]
MEIGSFATRNIPLFNVNENAVPDDKPLSNAKQPVFWDYLKSALSEVDSLQKEAEIGARQLALGNEAYLH